MKEEITVEKIRTFASNEIEDTLEAIKHAKERDDKHSIIRLEVELYTLGRLFDYIKTGEA